GGDPGHRPQLRVRAEPTRGRLGIPPRRTTLAENAAGGERAVQARRDAVEPGKESRGQAITPTGRAGLPAIGRSEAGQRSFEARALAARESEVVGATDAGGALVAGVRRS